MKKLVIKLIVLSVILSSTVNRRDNHHYYYTQEIDRQDISENYGDFSFGNGFVSSDRKVLMKLFNKETKELNIENHPTLKNIKIIEEDVFRRIDIK